MYSIKLERDGDSILATCPALPEVASVGDNENEALQSVVEAMELAIECRIADREEIPVPNKVKKGLHPVHIHARVLIKAQLHNMMLEKGVRKAEMARRLGVHMPQVDRMLNPKHSTKLDTLRLAFESLGAHLQVDIARDVKSTRMAHNTL